MDVASCHTWAAPYEAARRALSTPWIATPLAEGGNQGLLRMEAALAVVIASAGDDDGTWNGDPAQNSTVEGYVAFFQSLKPSWRRDDVRIHSVHQGAPCATGRPCTRCMQGAWLTGGAAIDVCAPSDTLEAIFRGAETRSRVPLRDHPADRTGDGRVDAADLEVWVHGRLRPPYTQAGARVWHYEQESNAVVFDPLHLPGRDQEVEITYAPRCDPRH